MEVPRRAQPRQLHILFVRFIVHRFASLGHRVHHLAVRDHHLPLFHPRLEAEVDILKVNNLSAEEIASQANNLYDNWQTMKPEEKREIIEVITGKIIIDKDEITIYLSHSPSCKDMATRWRKGWDSCPKSPFSKTTMRSAMRTVEKRCEISSAIFPLVSSANRSNTSCSDRASSAAVGSSSTSTCASRQ